MFLFYFFLAFIEAVSDLTCSRDICVSERFYNLYPKKTWKQIYDDNDFYRKFLMKFLSLKKCTVMLIADPSKIAKFSSDLAKINTKCQSMADCCEKTYKEESFSTSKNFGQSLLIWLLLRYAFFVTKKAICFTS